MRDIKTRTAFAAVEPALAARQESAPPARFVTEMLTSLLAAWLTAADAHEYAGMDVNVLSSVAVPGVSPLVIDVLADEEHAAAPPVKKGIAPGLDGGGR